jgi:hypothetical protein
LTRSKVIEQTIGVFQGDPMSPLLFNMATMDAINTVKREHLKFYAYGDDMVILYESEAELQKAFNNLSGQATETGLKITEKNCHYGLQKRRKGYSEHHSVAGTR